MGVSSEDTVYFLLKHCCQYLLLRISRPRRFDNGFINITLREGGYETASFLWKNYAAPFAPEMEETLVNAAVSLVV